MVNEIDKRVNGKFLDLDHVHEELNEIFLRHQDALIAFRLSMASDLLDDFEERLRLHMRHEEEWLLPLYEARRDRQGQQRGLGAEVYALEHKKMLELLAKIRACLQDMAAVGSPTSREIIVLLDRECTFKNLVEHHNMREHNILYTELDRLTSEEERHELTSRCAQEWTALRSSNR